MFPNIARCPRAREGAKSLWFLETEPQKAWMYESICVPKWFEGMVLLFRWIRVFTVQLLVSFLQQPALGYV